MLSNLFVNLFLLITLYPVLFILYFSQIGEGDFKRGTLFGIRCSSEWLSKEEYARIRADYRRRMKRLLILLAVLPFALLPIPYFSVCLTLWMAWMFAAIFLMMLPYAQGFSQVREWKRLRTSLEGQEPPLQCELQEAGRIRTLRPIHWLPLTVCNLLLPAALLLRFQGKRLLSYGILLSGLDLSVFLLVGCALWMDRMKTQIISRDSDVNVNFTRANKKLVRDFWLANCWAMTGLNVLLAAYLFTPAPSDRLPTLLLLGGSVGLCILALFLTVRMARKINRLRSLYRDKTDYLPEEDEAHWIGGILYYNPRDRHTLVPKRAGIGTTVNMATPAGKGLTLVSILSILVVPVMCIWLMLEEFTPIDLTLREDVLTASHVSTEYAIPLEEIVSVTFLTELPRRTKVSGTNMTALEKGTFRISAEGRVKECLNPMLGAYLRVETGDTIYYLSGYSAEATQKIYRSLCQ